MKKKVLFGVTALILVALVVPLVTACPAAAPEKEKIVVGMSRPLSGPNQAVSDAGFRPVYETWVNEVNADGGIYIAEYGKKLPIELKIYDDESDITKMVQNTEKLILEDEVDFLWPTCGDITMLLAQAPIANKYGYILITAEGVSSSFKETLNSLPYVFATLSFSDWNQVPVLADLLASKGCQSAYIVYIPDQYCTEYKNAASIEFGRVGIRTYVAKSISSDIEDISPIIQEAKDSGADAFMCFAYPPQILAAVDASIKLDYNPKAWLGGPTVNFGFFHTAYSAMTEGVMGWTSWSAKSSPALAALANKLYKDKPENMQDWWGSALYWAGLDMWKAAIEKAGTLDQTVIRDILATEHFQTVLGETWFENGLLAKECHPGEVGQWINGVYEVVGPPDKATEPFIYPKPEWP